MHRHIIQQLNELNSTFYELISHEFSDSREKPWAGWEQSLPILGNVFLQKSHPKVLDVGCGNGRLGQFLAAHFPQEFSYVGVDNSRELLEKAEEKLTPLSLRTELYLMDVVESLLNNSLAEKLTNLQFDCIFMFGVLHHIPSFALRQQLVQDLHSLLSPKGMCVITTWRFDRDARLLERQVSPEELGLQKNELEERDFFLTWERGQRATRYCHLVDEQEAEKLFSHSGFSIQETFEADGKEQNLNTYYFLSPT